jgi:hypothetical protein
MHDLCHRDLKEDAFRTLLDRNEDHSTNFNFPFGTVERTFNQLRL